MTLRSVYFDTPDRDLHRRGISLRIRQEDGAFVQTVKSSRGSGLFDRDEWESKVKGKKPDPSAWAGTAAASILKGKRGKSLAPIFVTTVGRHVGVINEGENTVEVSLDEGTISGNGFSEPNFELELELKSGDRGALFAIARRFAADAILNLSFESKASRGFRLSGQKPLAARKASAVEILSGVSGAEAFPVVVRACFTQIAGNAELLRRAHDSEVLHQLRVGLRRLRAAFTTFGPILPRAGIDRFKAETKWLGGKLDEARNLDVLIKNSGQAPLAVPADADSDPLGTQLSAARAAAYKGVVRAIASRRFAAFLLDCAAWVELEAEPQNDGRAEGRARDDDVRVFARRALDDLRRRVRKKGKHLRTIEAAPRHKLRIEAKKLRYAAEFFEASFGHRARKRHRKFVAKLESLQDALGELNDVSTAKRTVLAGIRGHAEMASRAGKLVVARTREEPGLVIDATKAFARWRRAKPFWRHNRK